MWLWLRKKLPKSFLLWSKLTGYVGALHLAVLFGLFFVYKGENHSLSFTLNRHIDLNAAVVFLPLQKRAGGLNAPAAVEKSAPVVEQPAVKKSEEKKTQESQTKKEAKTKEGKASTALASVAQKKKTKPKNKKTAKKVHDKKPDPEVLAQKDTPKKDEPKPEQELKKQDEQTILPVAADVANAQIGTENIQYLGQLDLEALQMHNVINEEVGTHWSPPPGISKNAMCEISVIVGWDGKVNFSIKESSGIAMYDVSARSAMLKVSFPKQLWGKEFSIVFKQ